MKPDQPDLTPEQQAIEHLLLYECRLLIDAGIKSLDQNLLFVGPRCHASVRYGALHKRNSLGDHAPELDGIIDCARESLAPPGNYAPHLEDITDKTQETPPTSSLSTTQGPFSPPLDQPSSNHPAASSSPPSASPRAQDH